MRNFMGGVLDWLGSADGRRMLVVVVVLLSGTGTVALVVDEDGAGPAPARTVWTLSRVDAGDADLARDDAITAPTAAVKALDARSEGGLREAHDASVTPAGVLPAGTPLAAQEWPGCRTRLVRNFSSRTASLWARKRVIVWHQTVSREHGWASQDALTVRANDPQTQVSWAFVIGATSGRCTFSVPVDLKAWTQGNANSVSVGIEVERFGDEASYVSGAGEKRLLAVTRRVGRIYGIPMQRGLVRWTDGCTPVVVRSGIVEHSDLGPCGGGHVDVTPWPTAGLVAKAASSSCSARCQRARDLRRRHAAVHKGLQGCGGPPCVELRRKNRVLHRVARREGVKL
jgi:hypothetical protein